jgi:hypothetical protein
VDTNRLTPLSREIREKLLASFDTEDDSKGHLYMVCFRIDDVDYVFKTNDEAIKFLLTDVRKKLKGKPLYLCAVNLEYDLINLFRNYFDMLDIQFSGYRIIKARIRGTKIYFYDLLNHTSISVADMGEYLNLSKLSYEPTSVKYCKRDTLITYNWANLLQKFYRSLGCEMKSTIAATSLDLFRRKYLPYSISKANKYRKELKESYYGGRTEIFHLNPIKCNGNQLYYIDVNSLYPYVMLKFLYPNPNIVKYSDKLREGFEGIVKATIKTNKTYLPVLPLRLKNKLLFPNGTFTGVWTIPEFIYAIQNGYKCLKVHYHIVYPTTDVYFNNYVKDLYEKRLNSDELFAFFLKIMLNALYGKFAENNQGFRLVQDLTFKKGLYCFNGMIIEPYYFSYPASSNIIFSSYITSYARIYLHQLMQKVLDFNGSLVYCDTDSIVYQSDKPIFRFGSKLGQVRLEGKYKEGWFKLPKLYMLKNDKETVYCAKGVPVVKSKEFFIEGETVFEKPNRLRESLRSGLIPNVWEKRTKTLRASYDKRKVLKNGDTEPLNIKEILDEIV